MQFPTDADFRAHVWYLRVRFQLVRTFEVTRRSGCRMFRPR